MNIGSLVRAAIVAASFVAPASAQDGPSTCNFTSVEGTEFRFNDTDLTAQFGFMHFSYAQDMGKIPRDELAGRRGKFTTVHEKPFGFSYAEAILEDCSPVFARLTHPYLEPSDASWLGITFVDLPRAKWLVQETVDPMTDAKSCRVTPKAEMPFPMFFYHSKEGFSVVVVGGDFPGRPTSFRIDKNPPISEVEGLTGARAQQLATQIRKGGKRLLVSSYEWPNDYAVVREFNTAGLVDALDQCKATGRK